MYTYVFLCKIEIPKGGSRNGVRGATLNETRGLEALLRPPVGPGRKGGGKGQLLDFTDVIGLEICLRCSHFYYFAVIFDKVKLTK